MKKKLMISIAAAAALLVTNPGVNKADAASNYNVYANTKVYYSQTNSMNQAELNSFLQKYAERFHIQWNPSQWNQPVKEQQNNIKTPAPAETQQQPVQTETTKQQPAAQTNEKTASQLSVYEQKVVDLTNAERIKNGLPALQVDMNLSKVAREKSNDMQRNNYFSHTSPTYGSPFDMMKKFGITYQTAGENIAMGQKTPEEVVQAWMNSEGHRANILNANFTHIGVGYAENGNYWTQQFIGK
ncbi:CAP domain-containing protein [Niallia oryzisoli]|uniref:CAP domain-containing protein n=1 Tax=Niallia oryzisoli TaxID=1737571 RepID=A0ABZ2C959_9BACI